MRQLTVGENEAGQRLDKLLAKYLNLAGKSFLYKMIRKKNIKLNGQRCDGSERLNEGDVVSLYLSEETIESFIGSKVPVRETRPNRPPKAKRPAGGTSAKTGPLDIVYEDRHVLLINKPSGMLSQKARESDVSLVEHILGYLLDSGQVTEESLRTFRPSVCNRLDRNTSGLVVAGKTMAALQVLSAAFKDRTLRKSYHCVVSGSIRDARTIDGFLTKDGRTNQVRIHRWEQPGSSPIRTEYRPLAAGGGYTWLQVELLTGRTHQIRAHLASIGHPIVGDCKYGDAKANRHVRQAYGIASQLLHSYRVEFTELSEPLAYLSGKAFTAPLPRGFGRIFPDMPEGTGGEALRG